VFHTGGNLKELIDCHGGMAAWADGDCSGIEFPAGLRDFLRA
jgi:hypothetical protein